MQKNRLILIISIAANLIFIACLFYIFSQPNDDNQPTEQIAKPVIPIEKPKKIQVEPQQPRLQQPKPQPTTVVAEQVEIEQPKTVTIIQATEVKEPEDNLSQLRFLNSCYNDNDCGYQNQDPRQVDYQIGQEIKDELHNLMAMWKNSEITATELEQAALDSLNNPDGHVQQAALDLLAQLPPSAANFDAIIEITEDNYDAMIVEQLMDELYRYMPQGYGAEIDQTFTNLIITGAPYASQTAAQNIVPFLNPNNIDTYKDTLSKIPAGSKKAKLLKGAIEEFELQQSGGQR